jgi:hypothetical protein
LYYLLLVFVVAFPNSYSGRLYNFITKIVEQSKFGGNLIGIKKDQVEVIKSSNGLVKLKFSQSNYESGKRDSNSRPRPWQGRALPTELFPHLVSTSSNGEEEETRTPTTKLSLPPQSNASTNSATSPTHLKFDALVVPRTGLEPAQRYHL